MTDKPQAKINAPAFPEQSTWLNIAEPLSIAKLRGKIVLLEFFTFG